MFRCSCRKLARRNDLFIGFSLGQILQDYPFDRGGHWGPERVAAPGLGVPSDSCKQIILPSCRTFPWRRVLRLSLFHTEGFSVRL